MRDSRRALHRRAHLSCTLISQGPTSRTWLNIKLSGCLAWPHLPPQLRLLQIGYFTGQVTRSQSSPAAEKPKVQRYPVAIYQTSCTKYYCDTTLHKKVDRERGKSGVLRSLLVGAHRCLVAKGLIIRHLIACVAAITT